MRETKKKGFWVLQRRDEKDGFRGGFVLKWVWYGGFCEDFYFLGGRIA